MKAWIIFSDIPWQKEPLKPNADGSWSWPTTEPERSNRYASIENEGLKWTPDITKAERFGTKEEAESFGLLHPFGGFAWPVMEHDFTEI